MQMTEQHAMVLDLLSDRKPHTVSEMTKKLGFVPYRRLQELGELVRRVGDGISTWVLESDCPTP